jgi:hypothetical protein
MCVLHVSSTVQSFESFLSDFRMLPVYQSHNKGDLPDEESGVEEPFEDYGFSCDISDKPWSDVPGQVEDMVKFLEDYYEVLTHLKDAHVISDWRFDIPYECALDGEHLSQFNYLPPKLLMLAGSFGIGVELSLYWPSEDDGADEEKTVNDGED